MDIPKRGRTDLKSYFVKNAIPTESNFADLIDGALNQKDDGIVKLPGNPLSIEAVGDAASLKRAINVYRTFNDANPDWTINLNPRSNPDDANTGRLGFNISDGEGNSRLFIDRSTGNIGVGTTSPAASKLRVASSAADFAHIAFSGQGMGELEVVGWSNGWNINTKTGGKHLYVNRDANATSDVLLGRVGQELVVKGQDGKVGIGTASPEEKLHVSGGKIQLDGNQQIKFTDTDMSNNLKVQLWGGYGLGINGGTLFYAANGRHSWRDNNGTNERMALTTGADGGLTVTGTGNSSFAGNVGIGTTTPGAKLQVAGGAIMPAAGNAETAGIMFPKDPFGGSGDAAWIRYYARQGESTTFEIGTSNDADDHIAFMASGNVGIGINAPEKRLHIEAGELRVRSSHNNTTADIGAFYAQNLTQGVGIGYDRIQAIGSNTVQNISIIAKGNAGVFLRNGGDRYVVMQGDGNLVIYTSGGTAVWASGTSVSDVGLKENIHTIDNALAKILQLRGVSFSWKEKTIGDDEEIGLVAQEVETVVPYLVHSVDQQTKMVRYEKCVPLLIEAIKEQQARIDQLQDEITWLKA